MSRQLVEVKPERSAVPTQGLGACTAATEAAWHRRGIRVPVPRGILLKDDGVDQLTHPGHVGTMDGPAEQRNTVRYTGCSGTRLNSQVEVGDAGEKRVEPMGVEPTTS